MFVVFDLDGTLANCEHRLHHIKGDEKPTPEQWDAFFAACDGDEPILPAISVLVALHKIGHDVAIWSARSDQARTETSKWLHWHGVPGIPLVMRRKGDHRNDDILKAEWIAEFGKPDLVFEDRARVVKMWRSMGIPCFQVADGEF